MPRIEHARDRPSLPLLRLGVSVLCVLVVGGGCGRRERVRAVVRIADEMAAAAGLREPPTATVDSTTRHTLGTLPVVALGTVGDQQGLVVDADGTVAVPVSCPPELAGRELLAKLDVRAAVRDADGTPIAPDVHAVDRVRCPSSGEPPPVLRLVGLEGGLKIFPTLRGFLPAAAHIDGPTIELPPDARLDFAVGVASPRAAEDEAVNHFVIHAEDAAGRGMVVFERTLDPEHRSSDRGWFDVTVPLDPVRRRLGPRVRFVFETEASGPPGTLGYGAWGDPVVTVPVPPDAPRRPNVLIVSIDTLRADRLGCYGFAGPTTPHLDRFAAQGTLFENVIAPANWTLPSHATMLTGVLPCVHGKKTLGRYGPLPSGITPLAEILQRQGYATAAFTEDAHVDPETFHRGFEVFRAEARRQIGLAEETLALADEWLDRRGEDEFFLFLHTYQVHAPYTPSPRYAELFGVAAPPLPAADAPLTPGPDDAALYAAEIRYTDDVLGRFLDRLDARGLADRSIVVVTSDHGESFGEHGDRFHGGRLYETQLRVPLLWRAPGLVAANRRIPELVGLADVVPTILELLGLAATPVADGVSLGPMLRPDAPPQASPARVFASMNVVGQVALRSERWKVIFEPKPLQFDLGSDPTEMQPMSGALPEAAVDALRAYKDACARGLTLVSAGERAGETSPEAPDDPERRRKLRALGYVE